MKGVSLKQPDLSKTQFLFKILLGAFLLFAGVSHLTFYRAEFLAQVPPWVPMNPDTVVLLSGLVEMALGLALIAARQRAFMVGGLTALFFVMIFPGNIAQYMEQRDAFGLDSDQARLIRLFFQPVLVWWALASTGALKLLLQNLSQRKG